MTEAFGDDEEERFSDADWEHALGGIHVVLDVDGVDRRPRGGRRAPDPGRRAAAPDRLRRGRRDGAGPPGHGLGTLVMEDVNAIIRERYELGVLGHGQPPLLRAARLADVARAVGVRTADGERADARR